MLSICIILLILVSVSISDPCVSRDYGEGSIVCVCNATYCDTPEQTTADDLGGQKIVHYMSNKIGMRLVPMTMEFTSESVPTTSTVITVQKDITYQTILGYGASMTDAASHNILSLSEEAQLQLLRQYFSDDGNRYSFIRIPIGGTDFSLQYYEYDNDTVDPTLENFEITDQDTEYKIPAVKLALNMSSIPIKLFGSAWSAPDWMKEFYNGGKRCRLQTQYYQLWADYYVKFFDAYANEGLKFWGVTTQNEPMHGRDIDIQFNSMGWTVEEQRDWLVGNLGPTLEKNGYGDLAIMILDDQRTFVKEWAENIFGNETASSFTPGMAVHWYADSSAPASSLSEVHDSYPDKFLLYSEACIFQISKILLGSWEYAQRYMSDIMEVTNNWVGGWVDWNMALNLDAGPNWTGVGADCPIIVNATADEFYKNPMYYALAHISRFVPQGSVRIGLDTGDTDLETVAFITPEDIVVIVIHNKNDVDVDLTLKDADKGNVLVQISRNSFNTLMYK